MSKVSDEVRNLIKKSRIKRAIEKLQSFFEEKDEDIYDELIQLQSNYSTIERQQNLGMLTLSEANREIAKISNAALAYAEKAEEYENENESDSQNGSSGSDQSGNSDQSVRKILMLTSNPTDTGKLRLGEESRDIQEALKMAKHRDRFDFNEKQAVRVKDLMTAFLEETPEIVHFSGHGFGGNGGSTSDGARDLEWETDESDPSLIGGIALEKDDGTTHLVGTDSLSALFQLFSEQIKLVFLNSCYSKVQAEAIIKHVPYVIGMNRAVPDNTAIAFATGFYRALGAGRDIEFAFKSAYIEVSMEGISGEDIPVLLKK